MRAVIYARYSTELQNEASIEDQVRICKERIKREGWELVQVFQDRARSGSSTFLRPGYQAMLSAGRDGGFDVVVAEALDRLSRDQEDVAALYKRLRFGGIRIVTLSEGEVSELHVGLKGAMNALFLRDLAAKTHRGLRGRVEAGRSGGGITYGYKVVRRLGPDGMLVAGERQIDNAEAAIVLRIFRTYALGDSPKKIALALNADGIPAPRGGAWSASTINGNRARGTGVLNNELYVGRLVWNRLCYMKDPETGRRRSRPHQERELVTTQVPELRIVPQDLWEAARARQGALDAFGSDMAPETTGTHQGGAFWAKQRPRYLFSGLMRCGVCGSGFSKISARHFGCAGARNKGPTTCTVMRTIRQDALETTVLEGLRDRMMDPDAYKLFVQEFTAAWNRSQIEAAGDRTAREAELERVTRQIERIVDAIANGTAATAMSARLNGLEDRRIVLEGELARMTDPMPYLHPNLAEIYRDRIAGLIRTLGTDAAAECRDRVRRAVDSITLLPERGSFRINVRGELAGILALAGGRETKSPDELSLQIKMVAGVGFEPTTFRL